MAPAPLSTAPPSSLHTPHPGENTFTASSHLPRSPPPFPQFPLLTSREELPSLLVSLYKHWSSLLQKQATVLGWSTDDKLVLTSVARISRVHASGDVGVHCKLPFSVQRKRDLSVWESCLLCGQCIWHLPGLLRWSFYTSDILSSTSSGIFLSRAGITRVIAVMLQAGGRLLNVLFS